MALIIGMDEAGYGPNFGPLVVGATAWEVPGDPRKFDLWQAFAGIVEKSPPVEGPTCRWRIPSRFTVRRKGLENLENGLLHALVPAEQTGEVPGTIH